MKILYKCSIIFILLPLAACSPAGLATTQSTSAPQSTELEVPPPTPAPTYTPAILTVDQKVEAYLNGEINDVGKLSIEDLTQFSASVTEKLSLQRGTNPNIYNNEAYLSPDTLKMRKVEDGTTVEQQTIEMFVPISKDAEGNLMVKSPSGDWVTIINSANFDWSMVISSSDDTRIELPIYSTSDDENIYPEYVDRINPNTGDKYFNLVPMVIWNKSLGQIYLEGANGHGSWKNNILTFLKIETDQVGHPIYGRLVLGIQIDSRIYTEGSDTFVGSAGMIREDFPFWNALQTDQIYFVMVDTHQQDTFDNGLFSSLDKWTSFVPPVSSFDVVTDKNSNNKDMLLIVFGDLIAKKKA